MQSFASRAGNQLPGADARPVTVLSCRIFERRWPVLYLFTSGMLCARLRYAWYRNGIGFSQDLEAGLAGPFRHLDDLGNNDRDIILTAAI
ncbi:MAG: hypothetical protein H0W02_11835, partial [Ktedonobacteraceae bacterium]|nr:hypothetical protein [Ktedonobacteraceae bacterium]